MLQKLRSELMTRQKAKRADSYRRTDTHQSGFIDQLRKNSPMWVNDFELEALSLSLQI